MRTDGAILMRAVRSFVTVCALAVIACGQAREDSKDEAFELVDPYTGGERAGLDRAGYVGLGPFPLWDGVRTELVEEVIGRRVLWVETAHFKLGSTLETSAATKGDSREEKRVKEEMNRLKSRFVRFRPSAGKLDPWLRLHLYAQRVEDEYEAFVRRLALRPDDFPALSATIPADEPLGTGPYLGTARKFVVLLVEKDSHFGRVVSRWFGSRTSQSAREYMPGGGMLLVVSAETISGWGYPQEAAFHSMVAADLTLNFVDGLRNRGFHAPWWWKLGLAHIAARRIDEKLALYASRASRQNEPDAWKWEPRVLGLVANDYAPSWSDMARLDTFEEFTGAVHLVAWSRVSWLLETKPVDIHDWTLSLARTYPGLAGKPLSEARQAHERETFIRLTGKTQEQLDEAWRQWVTKTYRP